MKDVNKSIADSVKTGQYFVDSRNWYLNKYIYPSVERTFFGFISICFLCLVVIMGALTLFNNSELLQSTYTVNMKDTVTKVAKFQSLDESIKPDIAMSNYMLGYYVKTRESYNFNELDAQLVKMSNLSTLPVYNDFHNYMSINNVNSPQFTYQQDNTRSIEITSIKYLTANSAQVNFTATVLWTATNQKETSSWIAKVTFAVSDLENLVSSRSKQLDFVVTDYSSSQIGKAK